VSQDVPEVDLAQLPPDDEAVFAALQKADTIRHVPGGKPRADVLFTRSEAGALLRHRYLHSGIIRPAYFGKMCILT